MYVLGLAAAFFMIKARAAARNFVLSTEDLHDLILYAALGVIAGGRITDVPWCMVFGRTGGGPFCRHPSQLYEALLEGLLLFVVLWALGRRPRPPGTLSWAFIAGYGACRSFVELFREPDAHLGLVAGVLSMGQLLSLPMLVLGVIMLWRVQRKQSGQS